MLFLLLTKKLHVPISTQRKTQMKTFSKTQMKTSSRIQRETNNFNEVSFSPGILHWLLVLWSNGDESVEPFTYYLKVWNYTTKLLPAFPHLIKLYTHSYIKLHVKLSFIQWHYVKIICNYKALRWNLFYQTNAQWLFSKWG